MERKKKIGTDKGQDRCFTRLIINDELNHLLQKVRGHDINNLLKDFIKPIKMKMYATVSRRILYILCVIFVSVCVLKTGFFDKYISWNLRKTSISLLSRYDWAKLRNRRCFLSNPSKFVRGFKQEDCEQCENINHVVFTNATHFSDAMRLVKQDFPVVVIDEWSEQREINPQIQRRFGNVSEFVNLFLSFDDLGIYEPCGFASNLKRKVEDHHQLLQLVASGEVTPFYAHWENCAEIAFKSFRRFYERPEFLPANIQLTDSNWVILCSDYQGKTQKEIDISSPLYIMMVLRGHMTVTISPRKICNSTCTEITEAVQEDCTEPDVPNSIFDGQTAEGGNAAIICYTGYEGGGTITCTGGSWISLPSCTRKHCTEPDIPNGSFFGDTDEGGKAVIECNTGYEGISPGADVIICRGGSWTPLIPSCTPKPCPDEDVANGNLTGELYFEGSANVICDSGYEGGGAAECGPSNAWVTVPTCTLVDCGDPRIGNPDLINSDLVGTTLFDDTAYFDCHDGYEGSDSAECLDTGDWGPLPTCSPKDCGTPNTPNGGLAAESTTVFDGTAVVECHEGYQGGGAATCLANSVWDTLPLCTPVDCGQPVIDNGGLEAGSETVYNGLATVECDVGYEGGGTATCLAAAVWDTNTCTPVDCGPPDITNGKFNGDTFYTGTATVTCDAGYDGSGVAFCSTGAAWDILPDCTAKDCGPLTVQKGVFSGDTVYAGDASITCNAGYDLSGVAECESDGNWATPLPTCDPKDCGDPRVGNPDLIHSDLYGSTLFNDGTPVFISCHTGYENDGTSLATCLDTGDWGPLPTCSPKDCGTPTTPNGGLTAESTTVFNGTAIVECNEGYEGGGTATCLSSATWVTLPPCTPVDCENPTIPNGKLTDVSDTFYSGSATAECDTGYELAGSGVATCLSNGTWDTLPICKPKDCGPLTDPVHGSVSAPVTTYTSVATYTCQSLWQLIGSATLICGADGNWAPNPPTCDDIDCPALEPPTDGSLSTGDVQVGTSVIVSCDSDYTLFGDELIQCETGGTWNTTVGTCRRDCPVLTAPTNGDLSTSDVAEGTVVNITCDTAYTLAGANHISCLPGGSWNDVLPDCTEDCQPLTIPDHGYISSNILSQGTVVSVKCESGYTLFGANALQCRTDATWNNVEPICKLDDVTPATDQMRIRNIEIITGSCLGLIVFVIIWLLICEVSRRRRPLTETSYPRESFRLNGNMSSPPV